MSSDQYGWPEIERNEIKAPNNGGDIKWNAKSGSTVRIGQLLATVIIQESVHDQSKQLPPIPSSDVTETPKSTAGPGQPKLIRARRIKRKVKPLPSAAANSDAAANHQQVETKAPEASFLGQYLKSATETNKKSAESKDTHKIVPKADTVLASSTPLQSTKRGDGSVEIRAHIDGFLHTYVTIQCRRDPSNNNKLTYVLGKIEPCTHPAVIDGLCAVCGQAVDQDQRNSTNEKTNGSTNGDETAKNGETEGSTQALTLSGGVTVSISTEYAHTFSSHTSQSLRAAKKLNLVLDLDHTLLHATADQRASNLLSKCDDLHTLLLPFMEGHPFYQGGAVNLDQPHYVKLRPHLAEFLCDVMGQYEVSIYTAGTRGYAEKICEVIARHVADYMRKKNNDGANGDTCEGDVKGCLDERDLIYMKGRIEQLKKEKDEYLLRQKKEAAEKEELEEKNRNSLDKSTNDEKAEEIIDESGGTHMMEGVEEDDESYQNGSQKEINGKKRKRVTFTLPEDKGPQAPGKKLDTGALPYRKDPSEELEKLQRNLKIAEKYESEAQSIRMKIFGSRIISRTDVSDLGRDVKSLKRVFPCGGMMAAIVDDREDVWANADNNSSGRKGEPPDNLLWCKPYQWRPFQKYADVNNAAGEDLTEGLNLHDNFSMNESSEKQLLWTADILRRVHERYYDSSLSEEQRDALSIPSILKQMRNEVFGKLKPRTTMLLSGLVPLHKQNMNFGNQASPRPPVIRYAEELGAKLAPDVSNDLTHVVAKRDGTDKILRARNIPGCAVVTIFWLMECYWSCKVVEIKDHILGKMPLPRQENQSRPANILLSDGSDSDSEDDDFFDDFEEELKG
jgi:RNA polymerase II subunit A-like phosphatase